MTKKQTTVLKRRRFERVVVLVDITAILLQNEPKSIAAHIFNSVSRILQQCNEHSKFQTLWGYKFFDPCVSHMVARSKIGAFLGGTPLSEGFNDVANNLHKFGKVLDSIANHHLQYTSGEVRGEYTVNAISEVSCGANYIWDPLLASDSSSSDEESKKSQALRDRLGGDGARRDSNVIILFSSVPNTWTDVNCFFDVSQLLGDRPPDPSAQGLLKKKFEKAQEILQNRNIQVCFVDVPRYQDLWSDERLEAVLKPTEARSQVLRSLSSLVKTVMATELLVASPTLMPCNLVWNTMAEVGIDKSRKRSYACVLCKGATLSCDVQLQRLRVIHAPATGKGSAVLKEELVPATDKLDIILNSVLPKSSLNVKLSSERFLVRQSRLSRAPLLDEDRDTFGDKVLQLLDRGAYRPGQPGWQLLLLSLASQEAVCKVSLCNQENGHSFEAVLEPFTSHSAILTVLGKEIIQAETDMLGSTRVSRSFSINTGITEELVSGEGLKITCSKDAADYSKHEGVKILSSKKRRKVAASDVELMTNWQEYWEREGTISTSTELTSDCGTVISRYVEGGKASQLLQTMDLFLKETAQPSRLNSGSMGLVLTIEGVEQSFGTPCSLGVHPYSSEAVMLPDMVSVRTCEALAVDNSQMQEFSEPLALVDAEVQQDSIAAVEVKVLAQADLIPCLVSQETSEEAKEYVSSLGQKIEDCLSSTDVDRGSFAKELVFRTQESLYVLSRHSESHQQRSAAAELSTLDLNRKIAAKLKKLLLISPKKLLAKYKDSVAGTPSCTNVEEKVKELELQILLRLEMLAVDSGRFLEQKTKDELVENVCALLDSIQFHLEGGIFDGESLSKYCVRLLGNRYKEMIPMIVSKIFISMELGGCPVLPPSNCGLESLPEVLPKVSPITGDFLLSEVGVSQESGSWIEIISGSGTGDVPLSSGDSACLRTLERGSERPKDLDDSSLQLQGLKKKGSYHFASHASSLFRVRKFKSRGRHTSSRSKLANARSNSSILGQNDPVQIVCQTPAPLKAPSCRRADEVTQPPNLAPPTELTAWLPIHERMSVEQSPDVLEETPIVKRKLSLQNVSKDNPISLIERPAEIDWTSHAFFNSLSACPSKMIPRLSVPEPLKRSVLSRDSPTWKQVDVSGPLSFSALLKSVANVPGEIAVAGNSGSKFGSRLFHDDDDDIDDDDEDGIISTPFKFNASDQSLSSLPSSQPDFPDCHKRLDLFTVEDTRGFPHSRTVNSIRPLLAAGLPDATSVGDTSMILKEGPIEVTQLLEHEGSSRSSPKTECTADPKALLEDSCRKDMASAKVVTALRHSSALVPRSPLGTISVNSARYASINEGLSIELRSVSDIPAREAPGNSPGDEFISATVHDKENQSSVPQKKSNSRSGSTHTGAGQRKTRSMSLQEQNMARGSAVNTKKRRRRIS